MNHSPWSEYKDRNPGCTWTEEEERIGKLLLAKTTVYADHGESCTTYYIFDNSDSPSLEELESCRDMYVAYPEGRHCQHEHDCCGHWYPDRFCWKPEESIGQRFIVGYQCAAMNV